MNAQSVLERNDNHNHNQKNCQTQRLIPGMPLTYEDWVYLIQEGMEPDWAIANFASVTAEQASALLGKPVKSGGILCKGANEQIQVRYNDEKLAPKNDKGQPRRYDSPKGKNQYEVMLPKYPDCPNLWDDLSALKDAAWKINGQPCLVITEGFKKAISLCQIGVLAISLIGVWNAYRKKNENGKEVKGLTPLLQNYVDAGFGFILAFDADILTKDGVIKAHISLTSKLKILSSNTYSISGLWETERGKGVDDYIKKHGAENFKKEVLEKALGIEAWEKQFNYPEDDNPGTRKAPPAPSEIGFELAEQYRDRLCFNGESLTWMKYEYERPGVWNPVSQEHVETLVTLELQARNIRFYSFFTVITVVKTLRSHVFVDRWKEASSKEYLPFKNKVLEIATGKILDHSPGYKFTWALPREYNPLATYFIPITAWLDDFTKGNEHVKNVLLCYLNAILKGRSDLHKFLHLTGLPGTGKGTFEKLAIDLVGRDNVHPSSLEDWCGNRFEPANGYGKRLITFVDEDKYSGGLSNFRRLTGGDLLRLEEKGKKATHYRPSAMVLVSSNAPVFIKDVAGEIKRRVIPVGCNTVVPSQNVRDLNKEFQPYLDALINYLISIPDEIVTNTLRHATTETPVIVEQYWEDRLQVDGIAAWANENLISAPESFEFSGDKDDESSLYGDYYKYCGKTGRMPKAKETFIKELKTLLIHHLHWEEIRGGNNGVKRGLWGVRFRNEKLDADIPFAIDALCLAQQQEMIEATYGASTSKANDTPENIRQAKRKQWFATVHPSLPDTDGGNRQIEPTTPPIPPPMPDITASPINGREVGNEVSEVSNPSPGQGFQVSGQVSNQVSEQVSGQPLGQTLEQRPEQVSGQVLDSECPPTNGNLSVDTKKLATDTDLAGTITGDQAPTQTESPTPDNLHKVDDHGFNVGDKVWWDDCYPHCAQFNPFTITAIENGMAQLDLIRKGLLVPFTKLRKAE